MPNLSEFKQHSTPWAYNILKISSRAITIATAEGADSMRQRIQYGSPTGTVWHDMKNRANGFAPGSRFGNKNSAFDKRVHPDSGRMYNSVSSSDNVSLSGSIISGKFGWLGSEDDASARYFAEQDAGTYAQDGVGMGLINIADESSDPTRQYVSANQASNSFISQMRSAGFRVSGDSQWHRI